MNFEKFENLYFDNLQTLYDLCIIDSNNLSNVKLRYSRDCNYIQESINFLIENDVISVNQNKIIIEKANNDFKDILFEKILRNLSTSNLIKSYLSNFKKIKDGSYGFSPSQNYNFLTSGLRNFLISAKIIKYSDDEDIYYLTDQAFFEKFKKINFAPEDLKKQLLAQEILGLNAEKLIYENELMITKEQGISNEPVHVALGDVSAGYDILSYRKEGELEKEIYIEVKAVSLSNYQFHFSASEHQTALKLNPNYFIYLLPVDYSLQEGFDLKNLLKINNIKKNIFENKTQWNVAADGYLITKNL